VAHVTENPAIPLKKSLIRWRLGVLHASMLSEQGARIGVGRHGSVDMRVGTSAVGCVEPP
jgi:hypothetical protein